MRLHTLTLQAVGPFAGRHTIDFASLAAGGIFLLEGPTGAGKSTVIDAIVFALYGKVASEHASDARLRSAFAADDTETVVDLVFETGAGIYRVRRTPAYERAKRRGEGRARQQATVKLWRLTAVPDGVPGAEDGDPGDGAAGEIVSTRLDEAGAELSRVVGLDRAQFVQTMVLPQGEFASFLRADPEQRRGLLQRIFGTEVYERVEQQLAQLRREAQRAVADARTAVQEGVARFVGASGADDGEATALREAGAQDPSAAAALVTERLGALRTLADAATTESAAAAARAQDLATAAQEAAERVRVARRRAGLLAERERLTADAERHAADLALLERARRAAVVRPTLRWLDDARSALTGAEKELQAALDAAPGGLVPAGPPEAAVHDLQAARAASAALVATLERVVRLEDGLARRVSDVERRRRDVAARADALAELDARIAARPAARAALADAAEAAGALAATVDGRRRELTDARGVLAAVRELAEARSGLAAATADRSGAAAAALAAVAEEAELRRGRLDGFAAELASGLRPGEPCPVCGGAEHPHPAPVTSGHVTEDQVLAAERRRQAAERAVAEAGSRVAALEERCTGLAERTEGRDEGAARAHVESCRAALAEAAAAADERDRHRAELDRHDAESEQLRGRRATLATEHVTAVAGAERAREELDRDRAEVTAALDGHPTVLARQGAEQARVDAADAVLDALDRRARTSDDVAARRAELDLVLAEHGFVDAHGTPDEDAARAALAEARDVDAVERAVEEHRSAVERVAAGLADPEVTALGDVDLDGLAARHAELGAELASARVRADDLAGRCASARGRADGAAAAAQVVRSACDRLAREEQAAEPVNRMAGLAAGSDAENTRALSLSTYVLARRFEDVVAAANDRLRQMSDGRFELERSEVREDVRTRRTGLAMRVLDHTTERARDPRTLSGGETFYVSLCLALGMADVVTAEAGGIELGTLFVDEGFGSLDPHTLDTVLAELGRLRAGGRVVGLVSHVEAMKQAVAERIEVRRRPDGSSTLTVVAA